MTQNADLAHGFGQTSLEPAPLALELGLERDDLGMLDRAACAPVAARAGADASLPTGFAFAIGFGLRDRLRLRDGASAPPSSSPSLSRSRAGGSLGATRGRATSLAALLRCHRSSPQTLVELGLAERARTPTLVRPEPVIGMLADHRFEYGRAALRELARGGIAVRHTRNLHARQEDDAMTRTLTVAHQERRIDRRAGAERDARETVARVGREPEEVDEDAGAPRLILIERQHDELRAP